MRRDDRGAVGAMGAIGAAVAPVAPIAPKLFRRVRAGGPAYRLAADLKFGTTCVVSEVSRGTSTSQSDYRDRVAGDGLGCGQGSNTPARLRVDRGCTKRTDDDYVCARLHADVGRARHQSRQHTARVVQFFVHRRALFIRKSGRLDRSLIGPTDPHTAGRRTDRFAALAGGDATVLPATQIVIAHSSRLMSPHKQRIPVRRLLR